MCRSPNSSANHGIADGTRSVPTTFVGHSHIGLFLTKLSLLAVSVPRQTILCRPHLSRPAKSSKPHDSSRKTCRSPSPCPSARPPPHRPTSAELTNHFASLHLDDTPLIHNGPEITARPKTGWARLPPSRKREQKSPVGQRPGHQPNGTHFVFKVAGTLRVPSANRRLRHMECAYYFPK